MSEFCSIQFNLRGMEIIEIFCHLIQFYIFLHIIHCVACRIFQIAFDRFSFVASNAQRRPHSRLRHRIDKYISRDNISIRNNAINVDHFADGLQFFVCPVSFACLQELCKIIFMFHIWNHRIISEPSTKSATFSAHTKTKYTDCGLWCAFFIFLSYCRARSQFSAYNPCTVLQIDSSFIGAKAIIITWISPYSAATLSTWVTIGHIGCYQMVSCTEMHRMLWIYYKNMWKPRYYMWFFHENSSDEGQLQWNPKRKKNYVSIRFVSVEQQKWNFSYCTVQSVACRGQ